MHSYRHLECPCRVLVGMLGMDLRFGLCLESESAVGCLTAYGLVPACHGIYSVNLGSRGASSLLTCIPVQTAWLIAEGICIHRGIK